MLELDKIYNMDCIEGMKLLENESIDLIVTDMPFGNLDFNWIIECNRILKNNGSIYIQSDYRNIAELKLFMDKHFIFRNWIVWNYRGIPRKNNFFQRVHDDILFYTKSDEYVWNQQYQLPSKSTIERWSKYSNKDGIVPKDKLTPSMQKCNKTIIIRNTPCRDWWDDISVINMKDTGNNKKIHPYQKPIELYKRMIKTSSNENDVVLDCFMGSGTTALASSLLNRHFIGFEINLDYCKIAEKRLKNIPNKLDNWINII